MQVVAPQQTTSYSNEQGHFIKTFLISTKPNQAGWQIDKETAHEKVKSFKGKPFVIIPEHLSSERQKGHIFANSKDELLLEYTKHTHGIIDKISDPIPYHDGTDDYYYTANIKLLGSKAASELIKHGEKSWIPFAVSPHIWAFDNGDITKDWEGVSLSLVPQGAYGIDAVVSKYCKGEEVACNNSLAATKICDMEDSKAASIINSSLVSQNETKDIMSTTTVQEIPQVKPQEPTTAQQPVQEQKQKEETVSLSKEQHEQLLKEKQEKEQLKAQLDQLVNENKTSKLNKIFESVKDESVKKTLFDKYFNADVNQLNDFYQDVTAHVFPSLVEAAKAEAEKELKNKVVEENKGKSKAGSLPKEPVVEENSKAGSNLVPNSVNQVKIFDRLMRGEF